MVEHSAVNRRVAGSSPARGAKSFFSNELNFSTDDFSSINIRFHAEGWFLPANAGADSSDSNSMIYAASGIRAENLLLGALGAGASHSKDLLHRDRDVGGVLGRTRSRRHCDRKVLRRWRRWWGVAAASARDR